MTTFLVCVIILLIILLFGVIYAMEQRSGKEKSRIRELSARLSRAEELLGEADHSLNLAVINEVSRMEQNLRQMDYSVKGVSNLSNRILAIKSLFSSLGYDVPELAGKPYHPSDNHHAAMQLDETLQPGQSIVKKVIRPAVLFDNKLIQCAEIIVTYNPSLS